MTVELHRRRDPNASTLGNIFWAASSNFFRQALNLVTTLLRPMLMSPELFGLFSAFRLIPLYGQYLHLGAKDALRYLLPRHGARGEHEQAGHVKAVALAWSVGINAGVACALCVVAFAADLRTEARIGLLICAVTLLIGSAYDNFVATLKGHQLFKTVGQLNYVNAVVLLAASLVMIPWLGFYGALLAQPVMTAVMLVVMSCRGLAEWRFQWDRALLRECIRIGGPGLLFEGSLMLMRTMDRILIVNFLSYEALGYYALGTMMMGYLMNIPGATREVMEAKLFETRGGGIDERIFKAFLVRPMLGVGWSMTLLIGPSVLLLPALISWVLPQYTPGIAAGQVLVIGGYFLAVVFPVRGILVAEGWQKQGAAILSGTVLAYAAFGSAALWAGWGLVGVAASAGLSFFLSGAALFCLVVFNLPERPHGLVRDAAGLLLPFVLMLAALWGAHALAAWLEGPRLATLAAELLLYGVFLGGGAVFAAATRLMPAPSELILKKLFLYMKSR